MSDERNRQRSTPDSDEYDAHAPDIPNERKKNQEDNESSEKIFNDPIHGHIELHPLLVSIIDTRQFQRLRHIKQLGGGYYVFPGASHNRFEHSLGVSYLAGKFVESLQRRQEKLKITDEDVLCIKIAGLCHDLGHGPFSHFFDGQFIPSVNKGSTWEHEQASVKMLRYLIDDNNLWPQFELYNLTTTDLTFIEELIDNPLEPDFTADNWPCQGRSIDKSFLYEIVANKRNGVDVDKWDYFARDCHCLGIPNNFDWRRYMKFARVIEVDGIYQICCRDKEAFDLFEMFHTRNTLHRKAYKHKTVKIVEEMITEALVAANEHFLINVKDGDPVKMSDAIRDMGAYTLLTDSIIQQIMMSSDPQLEKAQQLLRQIEERKIYKYIGETQPTNEWKISESDIEKQMVESVENCSLTVNDLLIKIVSFDYGMKNKNPIDKMRFYIKSKPNDPVKITKDQVSRMLPVTFCEKVIRLYCKKLDKENIDLAEKCFVRWCKKQKHLTKPRRGDLFLSSLDEIEELSTEEGDFTPYGTPFGTPMKEETDSQDQTNNVSSVGVKKQLDFTS